MGHSMGGKAAMFFASQYPYLIEKLIIVDMFPFKGDDNKHLEVFDALSAIDICKLKSRKEADEILSLKINEIGLRQFLLKNIDRNTDGGYCWKMNLKTIFDSYDNINAGVPKNLIDVPTLFIKGSKSPYIKAKDFNSYRLIFPQAKLGVIENAGHWVHADKPDEFFKLSSEFILGN
jgi:pimeloyl-ACP methyl ester carboxylesterase